MNEAIRDAGPPWSEDVLLEALESKLSPHGMNAVNRVRDRLLQHGAEYASGTGKSPSATYSLAVAGIDVPLMTFYSHLDAYAEFAFGLENLRTRGVSPARIERFVKALCESSEMQGFIIDSKTGKHRQYPEMPIDGVLSKSSVNAVLLKAIDQLVGSD